MQNSSGDSESPWNNPDFIFMSSVSIRLFYAIIIIIIIIIIKSGQTSGL